MDFSKPLKKIGNGHNHVNYENYKESGELNYSFTNAACHSRLSAGYLPPKGWTILYVEEEYLAYSIEDVLRYIEYLATLSFKLVYLGKNKHTFKSNGYGLHKTGEYHCFKFNLNDYKDNFHLFCAVTLFRYVFYNYSKGFTSIPEKIFELKSIYGDAIDNLAVTQVAAAVVGATELGHGFLGSFIEIWDEEKHTYKFEYSLPCLKTFEERLSSFSGINSILRMGIPFDREEAKLFYKEKNYKELAKLLNIEYNDK